jgi:outer membrane protein W
MKKIYSILVVCLSIVSFSSMAQMSVGLGGGLLKSTEENAEGLFGGEVNFKYDVTDQIRAGVNLGFYQKTEELLGLKYGSSTAPISVLGEYSFLEGKFRPYLGLHLGAMRIGAKVGNSKTSETYFSLAPVVGADYQVTDNIGVNFNFKYGFAFYKNEILDEVENFSTTSPNIGVFYKF